MELSGKVAVVTGGGNGIGAALALRFAAEGASGVLIADRDGKAAEAVAAQVAQAGSRALGLTIDVTDEDQVRTMVATAERELGPIDLLCSNAGVATGEGIEAPDALFDLTWRVNVMAHVYAARAVVPGMLERGSGYLLNTCSAAGLLIAPGDAPYTLSKNAAVAFAEYLAVTYGDRGIKVSALCPQGVRTALLQDGLDAGSPAARAVAAAGELLTVQQVADFVIEGLATERFLILPHPEVGKYIVQKASDRDRWISGVRRLTAEA
jgi:NAD(P)-dependent dehydrogenase (short-subunit alcohol dehydrogenase family)